MAQDTDFRHILQQLDAALPPPPPSLSSSASSTATSPRSVRATRLRPRPSPGGSGGSMRKFFGGHTFDSSQLVRVASVVSGSSDPASDTASLRSSLKTDTLTAALNLPAVQASPSIIKPQPKRPLSLSLPSPPRLRRSRSVEAKLSAVSDDADGAAYDQQKKDAKIKALEEELRLVKCQRKQERAMAHVEIEQLRKERTIAERQIDKFHTDLTDRVAIQEYAVLITDLSPMTAVGPSHLSKLQAQLCKCLHNQGILEGQMDLVKRECHTTVETIKDELAEALQERDAMERELTQKLAQAQEDTRRQARMFDERMAARVETISEFADYFHIAAALPPPLPSLCSITTRGIGTTSTFEGRDASNQSTSPRSAPCDVDTGSFVVPPSTADAKAIGIAHRLERDQLHRERVEDSLRHKIDEQAAEISELRAKVRDQRTRLGTLTQELDSRRREDIRREMRRTHRRHASHSTVVAGASTITRGSINNASTIFTCSSGVGGASSRSGHSTPSRSGHSTPDTCSSRSLQSSSFSTASTRPPLHMRGSSDPPRGGHLIGCSPTW